MFKSMLLFSVLAVSQVHADVIDRGLLAEARCRLDTIAKPTYQPVSKGMASHFEPSNLQRVLTPVYTSIFDDFGGIMQSLISNQDEYQVDYTLSRLGRIIGRTNATIEQKICLATCMINQIMESDEDVMPMTSARLAVARGKGFCRHFSLATMQILRAAGVRVKTEVAIDHMFLKLHLNGRLHYTDPSNQDGIYDCNFMPR